MWMEMPGKSVLTEPDPSPMRCHLWASQVFPAPGRTRGSAEGGGRIEGRGDRYARLQRGNQKPEMSGFWGKRTVGETEPATQRGSYLEEAEQVGCGRLGRSSRVEPRRANKNRD